MHDDELKTMMEWEWTESRGWIGCETDQASAKELTLPLRPIRADDLCNRIRRVCAQLGTVVNWLPPPTRRERARTIAGSSRSYRTDMRVHGEGITNDKTPRTLRVNRALQVLNRHKIRHVHELTLADGKWLQPSDLPQRLQRDAKWSVQDYHALCAAIQHSVPQAQRATARSLLRQIEVFAVQQSACPQPARREPVHDQQCTHNKFVRISHVSDSQPRGYMCHFAQPRYSKEGKRGPTA
jgi:hypothetical protein